MDFSKGGEMLFDDGSEDKKYFYRNLGMKLGYSKEQSNTKEISFVEYDYRKNI